MSTELVRGVRVSRGSQPWVVPLPRVAYALACAVLSEPSEVVPSQTPRSLGSPAAWAH